MAALNFPSSPTIGQIYTANSKVFEWNGTSWINSTSTAGGGGGATGAGGDEVFYENDKIITTNYTITAGKSASSVGDITVNPGVTVTVPSGSRWVIL